MNYYKIKSISHNGKYAARYIPKTDDSSMARLNRIVEIEERSIIIGMPCFFNYVKDADGNDYSRYALITSYVVDWDFIFENVIQVETENSIYEFERVEV